ISLRQIRPEGGQVRSSVQRIQLVVNDPETHLVSVVQIVVTTPQPRSLIDVIRPGYRQDADWNLYAVYSREGIPYRRRRNKLFQHAEIGLRHSGCTSRVQGGHPVE